MHGLHWERQGVEVKRSRGERLGSFLYTLRASHHLLGFTVVDCVDAEMDSNDD